MDKIDSTNIKMLTENSRISASEIAKNVGLSIPAVTERIHKLEKNKTIQGYTLRVDRTKTGTPILCFVYISLSRAANLPIIERELCKIPEVLECHYIADSYDYILKVATADNTALMDLIRYKLKALDGVQSVHKCVALGTVKE